MRGTYYDGPVKYAEGVKSVAKPDGIAEAMGNVLVYGVLATGDPGAGDRLDHDAYYAGELAKAAMDLQAAYQREHERRERGLAQPCTTEVLAEIPEYHYEWMWIRYGESLLNAEGERSQAA